MAWLDRLETEYGNLRAALEACVGAVDSGRWLVDSPTESDSKLAIPRSEPITNHQPLSTTAEAGLRLAAALTWFWIRRGHLAEARHWFDTVLAGDTGAPAAARGRAISGAMMLALFLGDDTAEASLAAEGLTLGGEAGDKWLTARSLYHASCVAESQCKSEQALALAAEGLAVARELGDKDVIAGLLQRLGCVAASRGDDEQAWACHGESLTLWRETENTGGIAYQLGKLGELTQRQGDYERAGALYHEALALFRELNDRIQILLQMECLGELALAQDDLSTAEARFTEGTTLARELNFHCLAWFISELGEVACRQSDYETATARHQESLAIWQGRGEQGGVAMAHLRLGIVAQQQGDYPSARAHHAQCLALWQEVGHHHGVALCLEQVAAVAEAQGQLCKAARIFGAAEALRKGSGPLLSPVERVSHDRRAAALGATLGEAAFAAAWAEGWVMPLQQAVAYALEEAVGD